MVPPLSVIKIVKYCVVWGGGVIGRRQNPTNDNGAPPLSVIKIVKYCGVWGGGGIILQKIVARPLTVIKIVKYCGVRRGGALRGGRGPPKSLQINSVPHLCH